jgi:hypothetical protein
MRAGHAPAPLVTLTLGIEKELNDRRGCRKFREHDNNSNTCISRFPKNPFASSFRSQSGHGTYMRPLWSKSVDRKERVRTERSHGEKSLLGVVRVSRILILYRLSNDQTPEFRPIIISGRCYYACIVLLPLQDAGVLLYKMAPAMFVSGGLRNLL